MRDGLFAATLLVAVVDIAAAEGKVPLA